MELVKQINRSGLDVSALTTWEMLMVALLNRIKTLRKQHSVSLISVVLLAMVSLVVGLVLSDAYFDQKRTTTPLVRVGDNVSACIQKYYTGSEPGKSDVPALYQIYGFCYNSQMSQLSFEEEAVRRDNFVFQRSENVALLIMVISITLSGVALAGLQLFASYKLALVGKGQLAEGGEASLKPESVVVKSSVVGVVILAISFAFFMIFVIDVYTLRDSAPAPTAPRETRAPPGPPPPAPTQHFNLSPAPNAAPGQTAPVTGH